MAIIYLSSERNADDYGNCYGYYAGKCYTKDGEVFPVTDSGITDRTKKYTSEKMAIKGAEAILNKCGYVLSYKIEQIEDVT
ncbi:hypothetical protein JOC70_000793 [Clostridium pascui]|uniref:hypothetical protein n=1 Tax=Clostridium pascui TaxID=46609 RepID=UPI00195A8759|nr:hypothetical protein [Clostridium pascui]MBM7869324.1 hypothetical protein [Clostridium pascui]